MVKDADKTTARPPQTCVTAPLLNERDAAHILGFTIRALQNWRVRGGGPRFVKISARAVRYRKLDLVAWVEAHVRSSTSEAAA